MSNSFNAKASLDVAGRRFEIFRVNANAGAERLPFSIKILLENLLRHEDGVTVTPADIEAVIDWDPAAEPSREIQYRPARVLMQDFTGVPAVVDLAAMRDAMKALGGNPDRINPLQPAELVIDHSVQVDHFGSADAFARNAELEFQRNQERYGFLKWGQKAFSNFKVVQLQAAAIAIFSLPFLVVIKNPRPPFGLAEPAGFGLWLAAVTGEAMADWQLAGFRAKPWNRNRVCRAGLWYYSRHPNYFFEWLHWWAYVVMAIGAPGWPLTWVGPVAMGWALLKVTGIPLAEQQAIGTRGEDYQQYQQTTNAFFPWIPKSGPTSRD